MLCYSSITSAAIAIIVTGDLILILITDDVGPGWPVVVCDRASVSEDSHGVNLLL